MKLLFLSGIRVEAVARSYDLIVDELEDCYRKFSRLEKICDRINYGEELDDNENTDFLSNTEQDHIPPDKFIVQERVDYFWD